MHDRRRNVVLAFRDAPDRGGAQAHSQSVLEKLQANVTLGSFVQHNNA